MWTLWLLQCILILCSLTPDATELKQRETSNGFGPWDPGTAYIAWCDFNNNSRPFCDWTLPCKVNQGAWIRTKHATPTMGTGPDGDYPDGSGYFIYQEASNLIPFDTNRIESPEIVVSGDICIDFQYHMSGSEDQNELKVIVQNEGLEDLVWSRKGNQSSSWMHGFTTVPFPNERRIKVIFEAVRGLTEYGDTAVDNVGVRNGPCGDGPTTTASPGSVTTSSSSTSLPPPSSESCVVAGDPHYYTFDKQTHHFMGTCAYTLSKLCDANSTLPNFNVEAENEHRGGNTHVSYVRSVNVDVYGLRITLEKGRAVKVNGEGDIIIPFAPSPGVQISSSGLYVVVSTDFGLTVKFDGDHRVEVTLPGSFEGKVCGMCGNYNGNATDDFLNPDGALEPDSTSLGNSWQVSNHTSCPPAPGHDPVCDDSDKQIIASGAFCGLLTDVNGPFRKCHPKLDPNSYFSSCFYDQCELQMDPDSLCKSLQAYADACRAGGAQIDSWRNATFCPILCQPNSHYEACTAACPATCANPRAPASCSQPCVEGCVCDSGYLLYNDGCVPSSQCGCWHNGKHYPVGAEFWTDDTCSSKCRCPSQGSKVTCSSASCPSDHYCGVQNGEPGCYPETYGICRVHNDPHYNTFDRETHHFMGICTYTLAKECVNSSSLPYFNIEAKNEHRGNPTVSYVQKVLVEVYGEHIEILKNHPSQVLVNKVLMTLPVSAAGGSITVSRSGRYVTLETDFRLRVSYDTDHSVEVRVPTTYFNSTCGMCGNFNNRRDDDYMMPDGQQAKNSNELGNSWRIRDDDPSCDDPVPPDICPVEKENLYKTDRYCGLITKRLGPFAACHSVINPESFFESCVYDLCALNGSEGVLCRTLEAYADACQTAGVMLSQWRNATFCPPTCRDSNSHYEPCMTACPATCLDRLAPENCSKPCVEGCACNSGFVLSGGTCVPVGKCGCVFQDRYYSEGESVVTEDCTSRCQCLGNGNMTCSALSCQPHEICKIQNGLRGCYPPSTATCHIYGDPHYTTFDGKLHHFQGACNYTVVETCNNSSGGFKLTTRNEHRGNPSWTAINSVALTLQGVHIALRKNRIVYINGALASPPPVKRRESAWENGRRALSAVSVSWYREMHIGRITCPQYLWGCKFSCRSSIPLAKYNLHAAISSTMEPSISPSVTNATVPPGHCTMSCSFDDGFCDWTQSISDTLDWKRHRGPTDSPNTGPSYDHTTGDGYFIYLQGSEAGQGDRAHLVSPVCSASGPHCFRFWYHMFGVAHAMALRVYVQDDGELEMVWSQRGNNGDRWNFAEVTVHNRGNMLILLEGERGEDFRSDLAVDDVSLVDGYCPGDEPTTTVSPGPVTTSSSSRTTMSLPPISSGPGPTIATLGPVTTSARTITALPLLRSESCVVAGDPHYYTFDKQTHHFMGTCAYTLSKLCDANSTLPNFNVEAENEHRGGNTHVSYVRSVNVDVYGLRITLEKGRAVKVNGEGDIIIPFAPSPGVQISSSGLYVVVSTDFGLTVKFDGDHRVEVTLPGSFEGKVCGMCGNYNGNATDDFLNPDGALEPDSTSLGNSWQVSNHTSCPPAPGHDPVCDDSDKQIIASGAFCGLLTDVNGPFRKCHPKLDPNSYFSSCFYDQCELQMDPDSLCKSLQAYADACRAGGAQIDSWRNATFCPILCQPNSHYEACTAACPATCANPRAPASCSQPCVEGCVCDSGYLLYNDGCVPSSQCGCWHNGKHYPVGAEFWTDDTCSSKCRCPSQGSKVTCSSASCPSDHYCGVQNGEPGCYPETYGICRVHNDPHYNTFDRETHHFMGICTYTLAKECVNSSSLPYFNIEAKNEHRGNPTVSYVQKVLVEVYGEHIEILKNHPSQVLVNKVLMTLPVSAAGGSITVSRSGRYVTLETDFRLRVSYDTDHSVEVRVPTTYFNSTCGMCGNFNNRRDDDYMMPDGQQAKNSNELGNSWRVRDDNPSCSDPVPPDICPVEKENLYKTDRYCGLITKRLGPFAACHSVINPESFFESCVYDLCALNGSEGVLCRTLEAYADACQTAGVMLSQWRNATFCPPTCRDSNSHYEPCMTACPATCLDRLAPENCSKPCVEGCACNSGFVLSGGTCVPVGKCGCVFQDRYYSEGESVVTEDCTSRCQCLGNGNMTCSALSCQPHEICKIQNGLRGCYPPSTATCHIYGDPHYTTFDGKLHHFQGACNYTVVETCNNSSGGFKLTTRNEHRGNPSWTAINSVALTLQGVHIALRKNRIVYINGALASPPVTPLPGVTVSLIGHYVHVTTPLGLQLQFNGDHELFVRVTEKHKGSLCGLCGTYTGTQQDDFTRPDGVVVADVNEFGASWSVPDDEWPCNSTVAPPVTCSSSEQQAAEGRCRILTDRDGPFAPCHAAVPPHLYFESCVYDQCAAGGSSEQLCNDLESYATACAEAGVSLGEWAAGTICAAISSTMEPSISPSVTNATVPPVHCSMSCSFDHGFCDWTQSISDTLDWKRHRGPTDSPNTGPSYDHTTGDGYFIYLQGSEAGQGDRAHLVSPVCSASGPHCFRFWYHMFGVAHAMALRVYVQDDGELEMVWSQRGNNGDRWNFAEVTVHNRGNMLILLEGERGEDFRSDLAVDDVSLVDGYCPGDEPTTTVSPGPVTTSSSSRTTMSLPPISSGPGPTIATLGPVTTSARTITALPLLRSESCVVAGDPHYYTFDKQTHHFMGTCAYTLSKLCDANSTLPNFNVEAENEHRGGNTHVSYVRSVNVDVYGLRITLEKGRAVKVNGEGDIIIPFAPSLGVQISSSGLYVVVSTDFGLTVKFDGDHRVEVTLPGSFEGKVCGMCGNYNGNATDDFLNPDGALEPDSTSLGNSWQVSNHTSCPPAPGHDPVCDDSDKQIIASGAFCGLLTDVNGPFRKCHPKLDPNSYFSSCFYDQCELQMDPDSLCKSLQAYADACRAGGAQIDSWRNATFCPILCQPNSHYEACTAACPATCANPRAPASCSQPCVEGCVCDSGYLLYNDGCVPSSQCGCWHNGKHYPVGAEFWTDDTCSSKCRCPSQGSKVTCSSASCPSDHYCGVQNGEPGCYPETYGICRVHNDPHYNTFDRETHHFMGICTYTLAKECVNSSSLPYFNIEAKNEHRGNPTVSYVQKVLVEVYGEHIEILKNHPSQVLVNKVLMTLPVSAAGGSITVSRSGRYVTLETDFRLRVSYDTDHSVEVRVPTTYFNSTCGMCGNFNNRRDDDYMMPDGQQAKNSNELGNSWRIRDDDPSCDDPVPPDICPVEKENLYKTDRYCGLITKRLGPFAACHSVINPESFFESCVYDLCALNGSEGVLCRTLEAYADACQTAGVMLSQWRNATFCPPTCRDSNSHYEPCMTACPATCLDRLAPENCSKPCVEGCACNSGFVLSGGTCVPVGKCGCVFQDRYYSEGESVVTEDCTSRCQCLGNGNMTCSALSCQPHEICKIQNGLRGCYPPSTATCHIYGDPHYTTFDGKLHHFQGACNYTVVETCNNSSGGFKLTTRNEHRGNPSWTAINSVALTLQGVHIALRKNRIVYINGALASPPVTPLPGVTVSLIGHYVHVTTPLGLQLQFNGDHELFVRVTEKHKGSLCGLCGTYTGTQQDDFTRPDGVVVADVNEFGASWSVPDDEWPCNSTVAPPVTCSSSEQQAAEGRCRILTDRDGPFAPCHAAVPPHLYFESCVYDQCAAGGSSEQLCNDLESYATACEEAGVSLGEWTAGTICAAISSTVEPSISPSVTNATVPPGHCTMSCSFDDGFCDWTQSISDTLDWKRHRGPTDSPNTGPSYDHTTGDGYFIYLQGSEAGQGDRAHLVSPVCSASGPHCFRFWYHMFGVAHAMALRVYVQDDGDLEMVWSQRGNNGDRWNFAEVTVHNRGNMLILLEGERGEDFRSDLAVDDVSLVDGYCPGDEPTTTASTGSVTTSSSSGTTTSLPPPSSGGSPTTGSPTTEKPCQTGRGTCSASGDPHYNTFDGRVHHFMGNCTYTLSKVCNASGGLPPFDVSTTNEHRGSNTKVSYVKSVNVDVYGTQISLLQNRKVNVSER
nr:IgGFc-binding protein-like [Pelodiscus sinensis]|eukprot:XP_014429313.2 IgGFc-binding protein-like [Pelodiscus sinensis]